MPEDYYAKYGVSQDADPSEIRRTRKMWIKAWHPDLAGEDETRREKDGLKAKELNAAFDVLLDPDKRAEYDKELADQRQAEAEKAYREAEYERRTKASDSEKASGFEGAFGGTGPSSTSSGGGTPPPPYEPSPPPYEPPPSAPVVSQTATLPSFGTIVALLFWGAIALTMYKGCDALIKAGEHERVGTHRAGVAPSANQPRQRNQILQKNLVTPESFGLIQLGMSRGTVESSLGAPDEVEVWNHPTMYDRLVYRAGSHQTDVFMCAASNEVSTIWSNDPQYQTKDEFGFGTSLIRFVRRHEYEYDAYGFGPVDRQFFALKSTTANRRGACASTVSHTWLSVGYYELKFGTRTMPQLIDSLALGWPNDPPLTKLRRDTYTPTELDTEYGKFINE